MNKRLVLTGVSLIALSLVLFALVFSSGDTGKDGSTEPYLTFTDSLGNEVVLAEKPERVAVLFSSLANVWKNAGGEAYITVGESVERGFCDEDVLLVDSGAGKLINNELLISYKPDFVIYSSDVPAQQQSGAFLTKSDIPSAAIRLDSFEDYLKALEIFCRITGNEENYEAYGEGIRAEIESIKKRTREKLSEKPRILFLRSGSSQSSCKAKRAEDNFAARILEELGCINIADSVPVLLDGLSAEAVLMSNPDYIFVSLMGDEEAGRKYVEGVFRSDAYKTLDSRIIFLEKELYQYKPCERWAEAYRGLAEELCLSSSQQSGKR